MQRGTGSNMTMPPKQGKFTHPLTLQRLINRSGEPKRYHEESDKMDIRVHHSCPYGDWASIGILHDSLKKVSIARMEFSGGRGNDHQ